MARPGTRRGAQLGPQTKQRHKHSMKQRPDHVRIDLMPIFSCLPHPDGHKFEDMREQGLAKVPVLRS